MRAFLPLALTVSATNAWQLIWYLGQGCDSQRLSSVSYPYGSACNKIPDVANSKSILASRDSPDDNEYEVALYTSDDCTGLTSGVINDESVCFPDQFQVVQSYRVQRIEERRKSKPRSPVEVTRDVDAWLAKRSTVAVRSQERDLDLAPPKTHPNITALSTTSADVDRFHTYISAGTTFVGGSLSLISLVSGCTGVDSAGVIGTLSCATALAATCIGYLATLYHTWEELRNIHAFFRNNAIHFGLRRPRGKRTIDDTIALSQEEYMELMLHHAGLNGTHIGYHNRLDSNTTSPAFHFHGEDGHQYVWTISPFEDGEIRHSISFHHDTKVEKRQGYEGVQVNGGLDMQACQRKAADWSDLPYSASSAYEYYVRDLRCLLDDSDLYNANYIQSDVFDKSGTSALTIGMSTWRGDDSTSVVNKISPCTNEDFPFSENCVY